MEDTNDDSELESETPDISLEAQIANELSAMKRPRKEQRFGTTATVSLNLC